MTDETVNNTNSFCSKCGTKLTELSQFCSRCGSQVSANSESPPNIESETPSIDNLKLSTAWAIYSAAIFVFVLFIFTIPVLIGFFYIPTGIYMTRYIMGRLIEWHPNYSTLYNVTSAKLQMVVLWPINMLFLLLRLTVNRVL